MTLFDFVTVMVSMILALSLGHLLDGVAQLYKSRAQVKWHPPHTLWMLLSTLTLINHWWALWDFRDIHWNYASFLYILIAPVLLSFAVNLMAPERSDAGVYDLEQQFARTRQPFAVAFFVYILVMWFDGPLLAGQNPFGAIGMLHIPMIGAAALTFFSTGRIANVLAPSVVLTMLIVLMLVRLMASLG